MKHRLSLKRYHYLLFFLPSLLGMLAFYLVPYLASFWYAVTDAQGTFVGMSNFEDVLTSSSFLTAVGNTARFMVVCVPLNIVVPFLLAYLLYRGGKQGSPLVTLFMLPLVIPTGATVFFWRVIFDEYGLVNNIITRLGGQSIHWFQSEAALWVIVLAFLCKNIGFNLVLFLTGLGYIPREYYEVAAVEGAGWWKTLRSITLVYLAPSFSMVFLMSIINSFKIFREIFLLFGNYPYQSIYMLQHYMNNQFAAANLQKLSAASTVVSLIIAVVVFLLLRGQKRLTKA
ncbi:MAG TPA: sugar ABC transporter permease [Candidatus Galloscillospira stercoripullorum]|nr:sugar ABC transporter permease [Candidatus Galloscillospira stercoripullorum]